MISLIGKFPEVEKEAKVDANPIPSVIPAACPVSL